MATSGRADASNGRRTWLIVMACAWALLGLWNLTDDAVVLGLAMLVLAALSLAAALSPRVVALVDAPLTRPLRDVFRRK